MDIKTTEEQLKYIREEGTKQFLHFLEASIGKYPEPKVLKLFVWKIFGDYELNFGIAVASDKEKAKQQILEKISEEDSPGFDGNCYYVDSFARLLEANEPDVYDLNQEMSEWAHYSG